MERRSHMFQFWVITLRFQIAISIFMKSLREGDLPFYKEAMVSLVLWFFALDHPNYACWLPVHIQDMDVLEQRNPNVAQQFVQGNFVVRKSQHRFSHIALDHAHVQNSNLIKCDGSAIGLTENANQLLQWMFLVQKWQGL